MPASPPEDYDAVIIGHSQFERIPLSFERQERIIQEQIYETLAAINELKVHAGENFSIKQMEKTRKTLETKLEKLRSDERKDDVITFEQLGVDRLFVDESHFYKNLFFDHKNAECRWIIHQRSPEIQRYVRQVSLSG